MISNIEMLQTVAEKLGEIIDDVVFVGGATTILYVNTATSPTPRPTDDVDWVVKVSTNARYEIFSEKLRKNGFTNCTDQGAHRTCPTVRIHDE